MNVHKWADQVYQSGIYSEMLRPGSGVFPPDFPDTREIRIQLAKWERLVDERSQKLLLRVPSREIKRRGLNCRPRSSCQQRVS